MKKPMLLNVITMSAEPGGKAVYDNQDTIDPRRLKRTIVNNHLIGRYF